MPMALAHHVALPATTSGFPLAHGTSTETLREAAEALREWLARLDREQIGQPAVCYIEHAAYLLDDEATMVIVGNERRRAGC
jgi:hypothetical protein